MEINQIENLLVSSLIPYARNSRTHSDDQVAQIAASIREFGFTNPVLIDANGTIIAGHGRVMAAKKLGLQEVPCLRLGHLTPSQIRAYVIADNKIALNAGWDDEMLRAELLTLQEEAFNTDLTGFSDDELNALLTVETVEGETDPDEVPEAPVEPITKLGDIWILWNHRLMCGDSTSIDAVQKLMDGSKADMVFTDPPYGVDYDGIHNDNRDGLEKLLRDVFANYICITKPGSSVYVFHSDKCADIFNLVFREFFHFSSMIVWFKNTLTLSRTDYQSQHEPCLYGWAKNGTHSFYGDRKQISVWRFDKEKVKGHTTPKPVCLIETAIKNSSKNGETIVDLFGGSGSTLIACEKTGRKARLMELDPKYCDVIVKRWEDFTGKKAQRC